MPSLWRRLLCRLLGHVVELRDHEPITVFLCCRRCGRFERLTRGVR